MSRFSVYKLSLLALLLAASGNIYAKNNLLVYVFKSGLVQPNISVVVDGKEQLTDDYGKAEFDLQAGSHEITYYDNGEPFAVTSVELVEDIVSQVFLRLTRSGVEAELDLPLSQMSQEFAQQSVKKLDEGPRGTLKFQIVSASDKQPISDAKVYFRGYAVEAVSDEAGVATIELPAGQYDVSIVHPKYVLSVKKELPVAVGKVANVDVALTQADFVLEEYVVLAPFVEGGLASAISAMRDGEFIGDALSSEQFSKSGDSDVAEALKRVTGVTLVDDKYVYIRGLGERYVTVLMNDMHIPSPEPTKRVVPLDIFPTGVIQDMQIQKTWSSPLPGTFAGGSVLLYSKDIPKEDNYIQGSIGFKYRDSTGDDAMVGIDNSKPLPSIILDASENFSPLTEQVIFNNTVISPGLTPQQKQALNYAMMDYRKYGTEEQKIKPGYDLSFSSGQSFKTSNGLKYGFAGTLYYKTDEKKMDVGTDRYELRPATSSIDHVDDTDASITTLNEKVGALVSLGLDDAKLHSLKYTFLWLNENTDKTQFGQRLEIAEGNYSERTYLSYVEEELFAHQLNGTSHFFKESGIAFFDELKLDWGVETAEARRLEPGTFEYEYKEEPVGLVLDAKKLFYLYSDLEDNVENQRLDLTLPFVFNGQPNHTKIGVFNYDKERNLDNRRFKVEYQNTLDLSSIDDALTTANVDNGTADILDSYKADDFYTAEQNVTAYYISQLISPMEALDLSFGVRVEDSTQSLRVGEDQRVYELDTSDTLPSIGATYRLSEEIQIRGGYSETITRPDFREFSPNRYKDPLSGYIVFGFPSLKYTTINNFDLKLEWYPSHNEYLTFGFFSKEFINPIETVRSQADVDIEITYRNAKDATSEGFEFGFRKNLGFVSDWFDNFYLEGNYTDIESTITLDKDNPEFLNDPFVQDLTSEQRPMQGQSPYVINLQLGYDNLNTGRSIVLAYNEFGERISTLGLSGNTDIYEQPFEKLDLVVKWRLNDTYDEQRKRIGYSISFSAENLLDSEKIWKYEDNVVYKEKVGRSFKLGFSAKY